MIIFEVPMLPPKECSPNWRGHWAQRSEASKAFKEAVFYLAPKDVRFEKARLDLTFVFKDKRRRDEDNLRSRFKPGQDALVIAGLIPDDNRRYLVMGDIEVEVDKTRAPLTIIKLTRTDSE